MQQQENIQEIQEIKEQIIEQLHENSCEAQSFEQLSEKFTSVELFKQALQQLLDDYTVVITKKKKHYLLGEKAGYYHGIISIKNPKYGFIINDEDDYYVSSDDFHQAFDGDEVVYKVLPSALLFQSGKQEATIIKVLKHRIKTFVGVIKKQYGRYFVEHTEKGLPYHIRIKDIIPYHVDDVVRCEVTNFSYQDCDAVIIDCIGKATDLGIDISMIATKYNFALQFPEEVINEASSLTFNIEEERKRRIDYTNKIVFTIDGDDAKDLDDAVSIEILDNQNYKLTVYIADVSYFVKENSILDEDALSRGTSVYLVDRVIPMLPIRISNDLCSLNPNQEKLVVCCEMEIDNDGNVVSSMITEGIINTVKRLSYSKCNKVFEEGLDAVKDYEVVYPSLLKMAELSSILEMKRKKRGALDFDIPESKVIVDEQGFPIDIVLRERGRSEKIIEEFMILANETVASTIEALELPFIYRVHDYPKSTKLQDLSKLSKQLGYTLKGKYASQIQKYLENIAPEHDFLKTLVLRMMAKAEYSATNIGHFGLASTSYTHFTSPIRRYPDLLVHRLLRKYLFKGEIDNLEFGKLHQEIQDIASSCSERERAATNCEFDVNDMKIAEYMEYHVGESFTGIISNVTSFGMFIKLPNTVEGLVRFSAMNGDTYHFDKQRFQAIGKYTNKKYTIGDEVKVVVDRSDKKTSEIDFKIVYNSSKPKVGVKKYGKKNHRQK